jgi:tRNA uridine 5-carbamoylmethylation protein Kti12
MTRTNRAFQEIKPQGDISLPVKKTNLEMRIVVTLCGLPGAGKSYFAHACEEYFAAHSDIVKSVVVVRFDDFELDRGVGLLHCGSPRCDLIVTNTGDWDLESYKHGRTLSLSRVKQILESVSEESDISMVSLVVVDDNMPQHSMRRDIYKIARDNNATAVVVWINTDPRLAFERNQSREDSHKVGEESWSRMRDKFEPPNSEYIEDRFSLIVDVASDFR